MPWSEGEQIALAVLPKISSIFSLFGSSWIVIEVVTDKVGKKIHQPYHRLLLAMSVYDILESIWNFASTWPLPRGSEGVYGAIGTTATCEAQGFFLTLSVAVPIYNALLALYYYLVVVHKVTDANLKMWIEPSMHAIAFIWGFGTASASAGLDLLNNANLWCWIGPHSSDERGENWRIYRWVFYFGPLWFCIFFATVCTLMVYRHVRSLDKKTVQYRRPQSMIFRSTGDNEMSSIGFRESSNSFMASSPLRRDPDNDIIISERNSSGICESTTGPEQPPNDQKIDRRLSIRNRIGKWRSQRQIYAEENPQTLEVFKQSVWFLGVFYVTHFWSTSNRIAQQISPDGNSNIVLLMLHSWFDPWQGFLNYCVYRRPKFLRIRKNNPEIGFWEAVRRTLLFSYKNPEEDSHLSIKPTTQASASEPFPPRTRGPSRSSFVAEVCVPPTIMENPSSENLNENSKIQPRDIEDEIIEQTTAPEAEPPVSESSKFWRSTQIGDVTSFSGNDQDEITIDNEEVTRTWRQCGRG